MNKIYNNLNIKNLVKTDWINNFEEEQKVEILEGLKKDLDISIYANPEYSWVQMKEIRWGLEDNLDVSWYAKPDFDSAQMNEIRAGLRKKNRC